MTLRILGFSLFSFMLGATLFAAFTTRVSTASIQDDRAADRAAIRAHIDSIFQAFIKKDAAALRATHAENWLGYLDSSRTMIKGIRRLHGLEPGRSEKSLRHEELQVARVRHDLQRRCCVRLLCRRRRVQLARRAVASRAANLRFLHEEEREVDPKRQRHCAASGIVGRTIGLAATFGDQMKKRLLDAREAVWRAYFAGDRATLEKLIPEETIAIESGDNNWSNRQTILDGSAQFAKSGGKLVKLEFPKTEIQVYGFTAVVYSNYSYELETGGQRINQAGRVTEVFVLRNGQWVNPGWHMDSGK